MANLDALKTELADDPLTRGYSGMSDFDVAADLNTAYRTKLVSLPSRELLAWSAGKTGAEQPRLLKIEAAAASHASEDVNAIAKVAEKLINRDDTELDLNLADRMAMVDALVAADVLSAGDKTSLVALATVPITRAEEINAGRVKEGTVADARP